jgi:hypothetical protein
VSALSRASACCGLAALAVVSGASTSTSASLRQVVDRTLTCSPKAANGARTIDVRAQSAHRRGARLEWLAQAVVTTAGNPVPARRNECARIAVRTPQGRPLVYAEVAESGTARLFTDRGCF